MGVAPAWAGAGVLVAVALGIRSGVAPLLGVLDGSGVGVELDIAVGVAVGVAVAVGIAVRVLALPPAWQSASACRWARAKPCPSAWPSALGSASPWASEFPWASACPSRGSSPWRST